MSSITAVDIRAYTAHRKLQGIRDTKGERVRDVSNAEINRELATLKRMFTLALQAEKTARSPYIPMLEERNTRKGFFELEQFHAVLRPLPVALRPVIEFAYITGWRIPSEVLTLQWHQVDFDAGALAMCTWSQRRRRTAKGASSQ